MKYLKKQAKVPIKVLTSAVTLGAGAALPSALMYHGIKSKEKGEKALLGQAKAVGVTSTAVAGTTYFARKPLLKFVKKIVENLPEGTIPGDIKPSNILKIISKIKKKHWALGAAALTVPTALMFHGVGRSMTKKARDNRQTRLEAYLTTGAGSGIGVATSTAVTTTLLNKKKILGTEGTKMPRSVYNEMRGFVKKHKLQDVPLNLGKEKAGFISKIIGPYFHPMTGVHTPYLSKSNILLHELGHAADYKKFPAVKTMLRQMSPAAGLLAGTALMRDKKKRKYAPIAVASGFAPMLYQEAKASGMALKYLKKVRGIKATIKPAMNLTKAFGTYAGIPLGAALGTHVIGKILTKKGK